MTDEEYRKEAQIDMRLCGVYMNKKQNAKQSNKHFELTYTEFKQVMQAKICAYTGMAFDHLNGRSVERVNPFKGYVKGNVVAVTPAANTEKGYLDAFMHGKVINDESKLRILRKAVYILEKRLGIK